jgi:hypothetical protein
MKAVILIKDTPGPPHFQGHRDLCRSKPLWWLRQAGILFTASWFFSIPLNIVEASVDPGFFAPQLFIVGPSGPLIAREINLGKLKADGQFSGGPDYASILGGESCFVHVNKDALINYDASQIYPPSSVVQGRLNFWGERRKIRDNDRAGYRVRVDHSWSTDYLVPLFEADFGDVITANGIFVSCFENVRGRFAGVSELETDNGDVVIDDFDSPFLTAKSSSRVNVQRFLCIFQLRSQSSDLDRRIPVSYDDCNDSRSCSKKESQDSDYFSKPFALFLAAVLIVCSMLLVCYAVKRRDYLYIVLVLFAFLPFLGGLLLLWFGAFGFLPLWHVSPLA